MLYLFRPVFIFNISWTDWRNHLEAERASIKTHPVNGEATVSWIATKSRRAVLPWGPWTEILPWGAALEQVNILNVIIFLGRMNDVIWIWGKKMGVSHECQLTFSLSLVICREQPGNERAERGWREQWRRYVFFTSSWLDRRRWASPRDGCRCSRYIRRSYQNSSALPSTQTDISIHPGNVNGFYFSVAKQQYVTRFQKKSGHGSHYCGERTGSSASGSPQDRRRRKTSSRLSSNFSFLIYLS